MSTERKDRLPRRDIPHVVRSKHTEQPQRVEPAIDEAYRTVYEIVALQNGDPISDISGLIGNYQAQTGLVFGPQWPAQDMRLQGPTGTVTIPIADMYVGVERIAAAIEAKTPEHPAYYSRFPSKDERQGLMAARFTEALDPGAIYLANVWLNFLEGFNSEKGAQALQRARSRRTASDPVLLFNTAMSWGLSNPSGANGFREVYGVPEWIIDEDKIKPEHRVYAIQQLTLKSLGIDPITYQPIQK